MADMLKITSLVNSNSHTMPNRPIAQSDAVFNIVDLTKVIKTNDRTTEFRQTDSGEANSLPTLELNISKNPLFSANLLKELVGESFVSQILQSGSPDVINEFNEFAKNIFIQGDDVSTDLASQQKCSTSFNGEIFDLLRQLSSQNSTPEMKTAIAQFLKNAFAMQSQNSILSSLSDNFAFLSQQLLPSKSLSQKLAQMAELFLKSDAVMKFPELKSQAITLLNSVSNSLIATDDIKNLVSLIKYNLSRFNDNPNTFENSFKTLTDLVSDESLKGKLVDAFSKFIQGDSIPDVSKRALNSENESFSQADKLTYKLADQAKEFSKTISLEKFNTSLDTVTQQIAKVIDNQGKNPSVSLADGTASLKNMLELVLPNSAKSEIASFIEQFSQTKDLNALVNRLSFMLNSIDSFEVKSSLSEVMNNLLTALSHSNDVIYQKPSSMNYLADFLAKTLNNENIAHLGIVDPKTLVHSMLTAPGVFTPLLHFVLPVQVEDTKSFGEVWIDNKTLESGEKSDSNHLFLTFDIEHVGVFELEIFTDKNRLDVNLYCPHGHEKFFSKLKSSFSDIANHAGYTISTSNVRPLKKVRNLVDVFPRISERRAGLNVKI